MRAIYINASAGVSGDMMVGALLDLGADFNILQDGLSSLKLKGMTIAMTHLMKRNVQVCDYDVILENRTAQTDVNLSEVHQVIDQSAIDSQAKTLAKHIFTIAAEAGAKAHRVPLEEFHFHERGALDSFADIVGTAICLVNLGITQVYASSLTDGHGVIRYSKGVLPVPVPAVRNIVEKYKIEIIQSDIEGELVTPTGAAIIAGIRTTAAKPDDYRIIKTGRGNGKRQYNPNAILEIHLINL